MGFEHPLFIPQQQKCKFHFPQTSSRRRPLAREKEFNSNLQFITAQ